MLDGGENDVREAAWAPRNTLGEYSIFVGDSHPLMLKVPLTVDDADGLPFMKAGCVFTAHRHLRNGGAGNRIPDLCRFTLDGAPALGAALRSCENLSRSPPMWMLPSMARLWDWNIPKDEEEAMECFHNM
jgi:hypothetical protein